MAHARLELAAGQVIIGGIGGVELSTTEADRLRRGHLGGVILMGRNVEEPRQVARLLAEVHASGCSDWPAPLAGVDQEGGRVARLREGVPQLPPARFFGQLGDEHLTHRAHRILGRQLKSLGFTTDFAPVLDVDGGEARGIVGDRAFSGSPKEVCRLGSAAIRGFLDGGICPCGKHFPGHGATTTDSHDELPVVEAEAALLDEHDLPPFSAAIESGVPLLMTAHVVFKAFDADRPVTCSRKIIESLLRKDLAYRGAVITDDMTMGAVSAIGGVEEVSIEAIASGVDLILICHEPDLQERVREALWTAARGSQAFAQRLEEAATRSRRLRERFSPSPAADLDDALADSEALELARDLALAHR